MKQERKPGWMREQMPRVAALVDEHRTLYGDAHVVECIKAGMAGQPNQFYAIEGGQVVGTPFTCAMQMGNVGLAFAMGAAALVLRIPREPVADPREVVPELPKVRLLGGKHGAH